MENGIDLEESNKYAIEINFDEDDDTDDYDEDDDYATMDDAQEDEQSNNGLYFDEDEDDDYDSDEDSDDSEYEDEPEQEPNKVVETVEDKQEIEDKQEKVSESIEIKESESNQDNNTDNKEEDIIDYSDIAEESNESIESSDNKRSEFDIDIEYSGEQGIRMSNSGDIIVQDAEDNGDKFELQYIDIDKIAVTNRIRNSKNVESLVKSIKSTGLLNPVVVAPLETKGLYVLINGYRRIIACAKAGIKSIPAVVNTKINIPDVPILEAMYNHSSDYTMKEIVGYIEYLEREKNINNPAMIEYLLQLENGDYTKLKDILTDNDDDIVSALMNGQMTIGQAFKKLESRRKKESKEEKELKRTEQVYGDSNESGVEQLKGSGEEADDESVLSDEEIESLALSNEEISESANESLDNMVTAGDSIDGFEAHKQDYKHRERLDPTLRKAVIVRDGNTCQCCGISGQEYTEVLDAHHKVEVYLGGNDDIDNLITVCTVCHKLIHLYGRGELHVRPESELTEAEAIKFKKIVKLGNKIREGLAMKGMKREELKKVDNADTIGRTKPGTGQVAG
jgi:predicted HNH restriction endonuclease